MPKANQSKKSSAKKSNIFVRAINKFSNMHKPAQVMVLALVFGLIGGGGYAVYSSFAATPSSQAIGNGYLVTGYYTNSSNTPTGLTYTDPYSGTEGKMQLKKSDGSIIENLIPTYIQWSPTSYKFLISSGGPNGHKIYTANYNGSDAKILFQSTNVLTSINWSPDGTKIAFIEFFGTEQFYRLKVIDLNNILLHDTQLPLDTLGLSWNVSGTKIFTGVGSLYNGKLGSEYDLSTKTSKLATDYGLKVGSVVPIAYLNDDEVILANGVDGSTNLAKWSLSNSTYTAFGSIPSTFNRIMISNNRTWLIGNSYSNSVLKLVNVNGTSKDISTTNCTNITNHAMFSPDSKKILFGCSQPYLIEKSYDIATGAITNLPKTIFADSIQSTAAWQPGVKRTSSKTCTSGSYTMKSDLTFYGLSSGKRVMNPLVMTPQISGKTQSKKVEYKITVQTLKDGVWTTKQVIGPTTASTTGAVTLNPVDQLEYGIGGTKVIVSSGVDGDGAGNCSVTHYSS